jgi:hypothetical protein
LDADVRPVTAWLSLLAQPAELTGDNDSGTARSDTRSQRLVTAVTTFVALHYIIGAFTVGTKHLSHGGRLTFFRRLAFRDDDAFGALQVNDRTAEFAADVVIIGS